MQTRPSLEAVLWRDRLFILSGLAVLTLLAWGYMAEMAGRMNGATAQVQVWGISDFFFAFGMWSVMMAGMMLPSASPMALMFVLGVMNLLWMAALTAFCLIEKVAPAGDRVGRAAGVLLTGWGVWLIADGLL